MKFIEIDDIVGQAFIVYFRKTGKRTLSLSKINKFGDKVVEELKKEGHHVCLFLSRDETRTFFCNTPYFVYDEETGIVKLKLNVTEEDLIQRFCGYIAWEILVAFRKEENIQVLFE